MAKYLVEASYLSKGINGLMKEGGTRRREAVDDLFASLGGRVEAFYFVFGDRDVVIIGELPDRTSSTTNLLNDGMRRTGSALRATRRSARFYCG